MIGLVLLTIVLALVLAVLAVALWNGTYSSERFREHHSTRTLGLGCLEHHLCTILLNKAYFLPLCHTCQFSKKNSVSTYKSNTQAHAHTHSMDMLSNINLMAAGAGLAGQYMGPSLPMIVEMSDKNKEHLGVALGVGLVTMDPMAGALAGAADFALCTLYENVTALEVLTPVRGAIASATAGYLQTML